jgi:aspartyl-tRNA(Asn)/glutamyl-tRNA(Gln) amidotransferase subunit A
MLGTYALSSGYYDAYYRKAQQVRTLICQDFERAFSDVDVIASPVSPTTAFKIGEKSADPLNMYLSDVYTLPASLAGLCGLSVPVTPTDASATSPSLPVGLQLLGVRLLKKPYFP